jgi:hypothetical protein
MRIVANAGSDKVADHLQASEWDIAAARLSAHGLELVPGTVKRLLLNTGQAWAAALAGSTQERSARNRLRLRGKARQIVRKLEHADIRSGRVGLAQSALISRDDTLSLALAGQCAPTLPELGLAPQEASGFVMSAETPEEQAQFTQWFEDQWRGAHRSAEVDGFLAALRTFAARHDTNTVYTAALHQLFADMSEGADADKIVDPATGIRNTQVWHKLYRFQVDGAIGAIDKLMRFGGCILADSVGLGKTFEALAVIKYFELRNERVLVLAPKRLRDNWTLWKQNDVRNVLAGDRFAYDVLNHTDLSRQRGLSGDIDLEHINWGNYGLVVIDESHNFRNRPANASDTSPSRYDRLMRQVIRSGIKTRVLMLSATPVNNRLNDLKNQIAFATEGSDHALADHGLANISTTIRQAQSQFRKWQQLPDTVRTPQRLLDMLGFDYFRLLDLLTIARSRKHVAKYYGTAETGVFPDKLPPKNIKSEADLAGAFPPIADVNRDIRRLNLAAYAPLRYVLENRRSAYEDRYNQAVKGGSGVFRQLDREESLVALMRVNLLKRMESSVHAFALTLERQLATVTDLITRIDRHDESIDAPDITELDDDDPLFEELGVGRRVKVLLHDADLPRWRQDLDQDRERLNALLAKSRQITRARDAKLADLRTFIRAKRADPFNPGNGKVLVFTAFADTALYLYEALREELDIPMALVTGSGSNKTNLPRLRTDLGSLLTAFSPRSKNRPATLDKEPELEVMIATDCISEGQNLQDCDCVVNYDIHWNPVRIVQRFGRVDRLGSRNAKIQLVNFWPNIELDAYIGLERAVSGKMMLLDVSATGEENLIEADSGDRMNDLEYRRRQLEALQQRVVDLEELDSGVSITDLTLNDLRLDLAQLPEDRRAELSGLPPGLYAPVFATADFPPGALFVLQAATSVAMEAIDPADPLRPFALVYVGMEGEVIVPPSQPKRALDLLRLAATIPAAAQEAAWSRFDHQTTGGDRMGRWQGLLADAIRTATGKAEERVIASLFSPGGTRGTGADPGLDDWEVAAWLAVIPAEPAAS